jgi:hypothetical protein
VYALEAYDYIVTTSDCVYLSFFRVKYLPQREDSCNESEGSVQSTEEGLRDLMTLGVLSPEFSGDNQGGRE